MIGEDIWPLIRGAHVVSDNTPWPGLRGVAMQVCSAAEDALENNDGTIVRLAFDADEIFYLVSGLVRGGLTNKKIKARQWRRRAVRRELGERVGSAAVDRCCDLLRFPLMERIGHNVTGMPFRIRRVAMSFHRGGAGR